MNVLDSLIDGLPGIITTAIASLCILVGVVFQHGAKRNTAVRDLLLVRESKEKKCNVVAWDMLVHIGYHILDGNDEDKIRALAEALSNHSEAYDKAHEAYIHELEKTK